MPCVFTDFSLRPEWLIFSPVISFTKLFTVFSRASFVTPDPSGKRKTKGIDAGVHSPAHANGLGWPCLELPAICPGLSHGGKMFLAVETLVLLPVVYVATLACLSFGLSVLLPCPTHKHVRDSQS